MKKRFLFLFFVVFGLFSSCSNKEDVSPYFFSCKIDGKVYTINNAIGAYAVVFTSTNTVYGTEQESVNTSTPRTMYITLESSKGVGVHQCNGKNSIFFEDADKAVYRTNFNNGSGQIEITEKTAELIKGKFSGTANTFTSPIKKIVVTEGEFVVKFR